MTDAARFDRFGCRARCSATHGVDLHRPDLQALKCRNRVCRGFGEDHRSQAKLAFVGQLDRLLEIGKFKDRIDWTKSFVANEKALIRNIGYHRRRIKITKPIESGTAAKKTRSETACVNHLRRHLFELHRIDKRSHLNFRYMT